MPQHLPAYCYSAIANFGRGMAHGWASEDELEAVIRCLCEMHAPDHRGDAVAFLLWHARQHRAWEAAAMELAQHRIRRTGWQMLQENAADALIRARILDICDCLTLREVRGIWRALARQFEKWGHR